MVLQDGDGVTIVDAGGGTIDVSSYSRNLKAAKETFEEVAAPQCRVTFTFWSHPFIHALLPSGHFYGSVFVSIHARLFLDSMYPCYLAYSFIFTPIQISWQIRLSSTTLNILFDALIKRRNYASEKLKNHSISNLGPLGIMMRPITFASASWSSWGEWFLQKHRMLVTGFI